jgi:limonene-1,2-epoxide hydrolase
LKAAETTTQPEADDRAVAEKPTLLEPWGTATVAGTASAALLLERVTTMFPAKFDIVTVHALLEPAGMLVGAQVSEDNTGVGKSVKPAV